jgi:hypothetical protein
LKLKRDILHSTFAFKFNLRRYTLADQGAEPTSGAQGESNEQWWPRGLSAVRM